MLYDHVLTFGDEVRLIWAAPRSFPKWMFLVNRYLTEVCLLAVANGACIAVLWYFFSPQSSRLDPEMSGFNSRPYDDKVRSSPISAAAMLTAYRSEILWVHAPSVPSHRDEDVRY